MMMECPCEECISFAICICVSMELIRCESLTNYMYEVDRKMGRFVYNVKRIDHVQKLFKKYVFSAAPGSNIIVFTRHKEIAKYGDNNEMSM